METPKSHWLGSVIRPTRLRTILKLVRNAPRAAADYFYDAGRYFRYSSTFHYSGRASRLSRITAMYHSVERGLALPDPRPGFGAQNMAYLIEAIDDYVSRYGIDDALAPAAGAIDGYLRFHENIGVDAAHRPAIECVLVTLRSIRSPEHDGHTISVSRAAIARATANVTADFFLERHSIRQFSGEPVRTADIDVAIAIAQKSPAVCNRQECRVYVVRDRGLMDDMLAIQQSRGFNDQIDTLLLVTNRLTAFYGMGERNQCWIDGGMFAMSLVLGLHAQGLGTCFLNWSKNASEDKAMRALLQLPPQEAIITLIAVGNLPRSLTVAKLVRPPLATARCDIHERPT